MTQIIGFAGKKQSGKNTACNGILMLQLIKYNVCEKAKLDENGNVLVSDIYGERGPNEWLNVHTDVNLDALLKDLRYPVKIYALADPLKEIVTDILGIDKKLVYGTDEDKNTITDIKWSDMAGVLLYSKKADIKNWDEVTVHRSRFVYHENGYMTVREILQYLGTNVFRRINSDVWIDTLLRRIKQDDPQIALVSDVRFANEIEKIKASNGIVLGLKRNARSADSHASEKVPFNLCTKVIDNSKTTPTEQVHLIYKVLINLGLDEICKRA